MSFSRHTCEKTKVLILGASHVRRLAEHAHDTNLQSSGFSPNLNLKQCNLQFFGIGGRTVKKLRKFDLHVVRRFKPDVIFLQIGSNDLCDMTLPGIPVTPKLVANSITKLVHTLHLQYGVSHIVVGQCIKRKVLPRRMSDYNNRVCNLNTALCRLLSDVPYSSYWRHIGFWKPGTNIYIDGIHYNLLGQKLLYRSIRGGILHSLRHLGAKRE